MTCFEDLLNQLVEEGKIEINKDSVVVEFLCGCNRKAARVISKYKPKYYANDSDMKIFDPRLSSYPGTCFPTEISGMKVSFLPCDVLDVDRLVQSYDIGLFYNSLGIIGSEYFQDSPLPMSSQTYLSWLKKVKKELEESKFETLTRYIPIEKHKVSLSRQLNCVKNNRDYNIELLEREIAQEIYCGSPFNRFFNAVYTLIEKIYQNLRKNGALLIFEDDKFFPKEAKENLEKMQGCSYVKFREIGSLNSSNIRLSYAIK